MAKRTAKKRVPTKSTKARGTKAKVVTAPQSPSKKKSKPPAQKVHGKGSAVKAVPALGRPKVSGEEMLYLLFKEDFHARQVFDFLRAQTVKELEQYSPHQIVKLLSKPIMETVDRIRRKLAARNRYLRDDIEFAVEFQRNTQAAEKR